jgi:DNA-binding NarL/FixJ family response regulator
MTTAKGRTNKSKRGQIRVLVADDHEFIRAGVKTVLENAGMKIVAEAKGGDEAVGKTLKAKPDVVVLDVRMSGGDGLTALGRIKLEKPQQAVIMYSTYDNPSYIARAVALGAEGFILKSSPCADLVKAVQRVVAGENIWTRDELRRVAGALTPPRLVSEVDVPLTQRESEVLTQLALGLTNKQISRTLAISYETVKEHVQHILRKIGVADRTQAAVWAVRQGIA